MVIAIKYSEDHYYDNNYYSRVGGIPCRELNRLETELLSLMSFDLFVAPELYERYMADLACHCAGTNMPHPNKDEEKDLKGFPLVCSQSSIQTVPSVNDFSHEEQKSSSASIS